MAALRTEAPKRAVPPPSGRRERVACCPGGFSAGPRGGLALLGTFPGRAFLSVSFLSLTVAPRSSSCAVKRGRWPADPCARQRPPHRGRPPGVAPQHGEGPERKQVSGQGRSLLWGPPTPCGRKRLPSSTGPRAASAGHMQETLRGHPGAQGRYQTCLSCGKRREKEAKNKCGAWAGSPESATG